MSVVPTKETRVLSIRFLTSSPWNEEALNYGLGIMMNEGVENLSRHQDDKIGFFIIGYPLLGDVHKKKRRLHQKGRLQDQGQDSN
jgi:hypothetical protein